VFFTGWSEVSPDKRPTFLAIGLMIVYLIVLYTSSFANYFGLVTPGGREMDYYWSTGRMVFCVTDDLAA
jgi:hypothetical protein